MPALANSRKISEPDIVKYRGKLLSWYDSHARDVPWRSKVGNLPDPYHVWLSEIMCQQTTVSAVKAYYKKFLILWPSVYELAAAQQDDVMAAWAGLGYYARARNLHKCAQIVAGQLNGVFPSTPEGLKKLPGIGDYTSAAIAAIAFNKPATVVDGNVERVMARFFAVREPLPRAKKQLKSLAHRFFDGFAERPGDLAQSFMDLGADICIPKAPRCSACPLMHACKAYQQGIAARLPDKNKTNMRPQKHGHVYWITNSKGEVLFHKRAEKGLLGGMLGLPTSNWVNDKGKLTHLKYLRRLQPLNVKIHHTFSHFDLELELYIARLSKGKVLESVVWGRPEHHGPKLPTVFKKAYKVFCD